MKMLVCLAFLGVMLSFYSCKDDSVNPSEPSGTYLYKGYDSLGAQIVEGWLKLNFEDSIKITGNWNLEKVGGQSEMGPQVGSGELIGGQTNGNIWISLNPNFTDNNVNLSGELINGKYSGDWTYSSFTGVTNYGTFKAVKE